jgi:hypothetical protein
MSMETSLVAAGEIAPTVRAAECGENARTSAWLETAVAVGFAITAVLVVSFVAVMTVLV